MDKLEGETLVLLAELLIRGIKDGHHQALELFPKLLSVISSKKTIKYCKGKCPLGFHSCASPPSLASPPPPPSPLPSPPLPSPPLPPLPLPLPPPENGVEGEMSGDSQKGHLLNSLCGCRWDTGCVQHIAHMCQEIPMTSDELEFLIEKILRYS